MGGTMRLGSYGARLAPGSQVAEAYGTEVVEERHRHRYEVNPRFRHRLEEAGLACSGTSPDGRLVEFVELPGHPFWVGTQAHPEFKSRPDRPAPALPRAGRCRPGPRQGSRAAAVSTLGPSPDRGGGVPDQTPPGFRHVADETVYRGFIVSTAQGLTSSTPTGNRFDRDIDPAPGGGRHRAPDRGEPSVLLVRQFRPAVDRWILEVPAGTRDVDGEPTRDHCPSGAGRRGWAGGAGRLDLLTHCLNTPGFCDEVTTVFLATDLHPVPTNRQGLEERFMSIEELSLSRFDELVDEGTIVDAVTILGVALARRRRQGSVRAG